MKSLELFDRVFKKGAEIMLLHEPLNDTNESDRRLNICKSCDQYNAKRDKCTECSCYMSVKTPMLKHKNPAKLGRIEITHCPLGKWGDSIIADYYRNK